MWKIKKEHTHGGTCPGGWLIGNYSLGLERTVVRVKGEPYLGRWILYVLGRTIRLHKFYKGDDARAPHDHPWSFWTFPLCRGYVEWVIDTDKKLTRKWVKGWRLNYRPADYQHIVEDPPWPFWTIVVTSKRERSWGFWPVFPGCYRPVVRYFVPWREWEKRDSRIKEVLK
jgi:hypothetical protein